MMMPWLLMVTAGNSIFKLHVPDLYDVTRPKGSKRTSASVTNATEEQQLVNLFTVQPHTLSAKIIHYHMMLS